MSITLEKFTSKHINDALSLAICELNAERKFCRDLPSDDFKNHLKGILHRLSDSPCGKVAIQNEKLVGYILFAGPWDGFFGDVKGVFSPLGASAFSYEFENRSRLASMLFASAAEDFVKSGIYSCALCRYAHDEETAKAFIFNGFGIRCCDAVREVSSISCPINYSNVVFEELSPDRFSEVKTLQKGLHSHLLHSPVFFPPAQSFDVWFESWIKRKSMRIFTALSKGEIIGFIAIDDTAENFVTEYNKMKNICGAFFDESFRGSGLAPTLLAYIRDTLKIEGVTHIGVDFETLNPTAHNFWNKFFTPYTYSFARRIDERVGFIL